MVKDFTGIVRYRINYRGLTLSKVVLACIVIVAAITLTSANCSAAASNRKKTKKAVYPARLPLLMCVDRENTPAHQILNVPPAWIPPSGIERKWTAIIIHHSDTDVGNAASFNNWHKYGRHWDGVGYDFVIGNGSKTPDGFIETTFRWKQQVAGAHCGGTPENWANEFGIGICLVGDFDKVSPSKKQLESLTKLVNFLSSRYGIPKSHIYGHGTTPGSKGTRCPGKRFSIAKLKATVAK